MYTVSTILGSYWWTAGTPKKNDRGNSRNAQTIVLLSDTDDVSQDAAMTKPAASKKTSKTSTTSKTKKVAAAPPQSRRASSNKSRAATPLKRKKGDDSCGNSSDECFMAQSQSQTTAEYSVRTSERKRSRVSYVENDSSTEWDGTEDEW